jgi:hypothetical protein
MMIKEPDWWEYAIFDPEGGEGIIGIKEGSPRWVLDEFERYLKNKSGDGYVVDY